MTDYTERFRTLGIGQMQQVLATAWLEAERARQAKGDKP